MASTPRFSANALRVLERRYLQRDEAGHVVETPEALLRRVARTVADADAAVHPGADRAALEEAFYELMAGLRFFPNSPALGAGRPGAQLAACFVLPVEDDLGSIYDALKHAAMIHQSGGGTGFDFSRLRPEGDRVRSSGGTASGPLSFIRLFDASTHVIKQGGIRRGANMAVLRVDHPDVLAFVGEKADPTRLTNFNVSVAVTDAFMAAMAAGDRYDLLNPRTGQPVRRLDARKVFAAMVNHAWESGEPGLLFMDRIEEMNPTPHVGHITATNPCGEQPLLPYESCILGSLDLAVFVRDGALDWEALLDATHLAVRFLDDLIEANRHPLPQIEHVTRLNRKIGLGVMGFADLLAALDVPYDSEEALALAGRLMSTLRREARFASAELAVARGPFPAWRGSRLEQEGLAPQRNATVTSIAPTGTLSLLAGCSAGIEPFYALAFERHVLGGEVLAEEQPLIREALAERGLDVEATLAAARELGSLRRVPGVPEALGRRFPTARDVAPAWHVRMQAAFQRHVDNAVSKTINLPPDADPGAVREAWLLAYELGCKGITVYREGSRAGQVLERRTFSAGELPPESVAAFAPEALPPPDAPRVCPDCDAPLPVGGRCVMCRACGWSACLTLHRPPTGGA